MAQYLFTVDDTFLLGGRGLVLVPGIRGEDRRRVRIDDPISLRRPDGSYLETRIGGLEHLDPPPPSGITPILLKGIAKSEVPIGTEIWSIDE